VRFGKIRRLIAVSTHSEDIRFHDPGAATPILPDRGTVELAPAGGPIPCGREKSSETS
jgi:hypothetical protein